MSCETPQSLQTVSYSRLSTYTECPAKYKNKYIDQVEVGQPLEDYFLKGTLAHRILEEFLLGASKEDATDLVFPEWLVENCLIPIGDDGVDLEMLKEYADKTSDLLVRCNANYKGTDVIRTNAGQVPKDPLNYMPGEFQKEYFRLGLQGLRSELDTQALRASLPFRRFSLSNIAAEALSYVKCFRIPSYVAETIAVEYPIQEGKVVHWEDNTIWNGAIDWVFKTVEGAVVIADHKSGKDKPSGLEVLFHPQLNIYAYLYLEKTGKLPDYIAINHLPTAELIIAEVDVDIVHDNYRQWTQVRDSINRDKVNGTFMRQLPTKYNSPCIKRDWKSGAVTRVCPYIYTCWPKYVGCISTELEPFLNEQSLRKAGI